MVIGKGVESIAKDAFKDCTNLVRCSFSSIESLMNIDFGNEYSNPLCYAKALNVDGKVVTELIIPESVTAVKKFAFYGCNSIRKVTDGRNVTSIGESAFYNNVKLTSVLIGGKVEKIGDYAFNKCPLTTIYNYAEYPQNCGKDVFSIAKENCKLYVLPESVDLYNVHQDWYEFNINAMDEDMVGVGNVRDNLNDNVNGMFDLSGRRMNANDSDNLNRLPKGIYIVKGKKVVVK